MSDKEVCPECGKQRGATVSGSSKAWVFKAVKCACVDSKPTTPSEAPESKTAKALAEETNSTTSTQDSVEPQAPDGNAPPRASEVVTGDHEPISLQDPKSHESKPSKGRKKNRNRRSKRSKSEANASEVTGDHEPISVEEVEIVAAVEAQPVRADAETVVPAALEIEVVEATIEAELVADPKPISVEELKEEEAVEPPPVELVAEILPAESIKNSSGDAVLGALASEKTKPIVEQGLDSGTWANAGDSVKALTPAAPRSFRDLSADNLKTSSGAKGDVGTSSNPKEPTAKGDSNPPAPSAVPPDGKLGTSSGGFSSSSVFPSSGGTPPGAPPSPGVFTSSSSVFSSSSSVFSSNTSTFSTSGSGSAGGGSVPSGTDSFSTNKPTPPKSPTPGIGNFPSTKGTGSGVYTGTGIVFNDLKDFPPNPKEMPPTNSAPPLGGGVSSGTGAQSSKAGPPGGVSSAGDGFKSIGSGGFSAGSSNLSAGHSSSSTGSVGGFSKPSGSTSGANFSDGEFGTSSTSGTSIMSTTSASGLLSDEMISGDGLATASGAPQEDRPENWVAVPKKARDKAQSSFKHDNELFELIHPASVKDGQDPVVTRNAILRTLRLRKIKTVISLILAVAIAWVGYSYMSIQAEANKQAQSVSDPAKSSSPAKSKSGTPPNTQPKKKSPTAKKQKRTH